MDSSPQRHLAVVGLHVNALGIRLCTANQRLFDLFFELSGSDGGGDPDLIVYTLDADQKTHRLVGGLTLELVGNLAGKREQAMVGRDREALGGYRYVPTEGIFRCPGNVRIRSLIRWRQPNLQVVKDGDDAAYSPGIPLGCVLLGVAADGAAERDRTIIRRHFDIRRVDAWVPQQLVEYVSLQLGIVFH